MSPYRAEMCQCIVRWVHRAQQQCHRGTTVHRMWWMAVQRSTWFVLSRALLELCAVYAIILHRLLCLASVLPCDLRLPFCLARAASQTRIQDCPAGFVCSGGMKTSCPAGTYQGSVRKSSSVDCKACAAGVYCRTWIEWSHGCVISLACCPYQCCRCCPPPPEGLRV